MAGKGYYSRYEPHVKPARLLLPSARKTSGPGKQGRHRVNRQIAEPRAMSIPKRILLHVAAGAGLVIAVATGVTYKIVYESSKQRDLQHLKTYVRERARREEAGFQQ